MSDTAHATKGGVSKAGPANAGGTGSGRRRTIGSVLVGLGAFLIVASALMKFYAYPSLATVPTNYDSVTELESRGAEIFNSDPSVLAPETSDLFISSSTVADSGADAPDDVVVWTNTVSIRREDGSVFQRSNERAAFDPVSGESVTCEPCDTFNESEEGVRTPVDRAGQMYKFPFDTQKQDYEQWDGSLGEATTAEYVGEETMQGTTVYKFVQTIEPTVIEQREIPGSVFGSAEASVEADMVYAMTRTFFIEPVTGAPVQRIEERDQVLSYDGVDVPAFVGTVQYSEAQVDKSLDTVNSQAPMLAGMQLTFPLIGVALGVLAIAGGVLLRRRQTA